MSLLNLRVRVAIIATMTAIVFISLSYLLPSAAVFVLSIEVILLPTIYIIGNYYAEHLIEEDAGEIITELDIKAEELNKRNVNLMLENQWLRYHFTHNGPKNKKRVS